MYIIHQLKCWFKTAAVLMLLLCNYSVFAANDYLGCYRDSMTRDLSGAQIPDDSALTIERCIAFCQSKGSQYAGLQAGNYLDAARLTWTSYCFCGNSYGSQGTANNCNMACSGDKTEICGGSWANSVYKVTGATVPPTQSCTQTQLDTAKQTGIDQCKTNPAACGITSTDTNGSTQAGIDQCKTNPASCGITFTDTNGSTQAGIDQCKTNPASCGITVSSGGGSHASYSPTKGEVYVPFIDTPGSFGVGVLTYEVYLLQKAGSFTFDLDLTRLKVK